MKRRRRVIISPPSWVSFTCSDGVGLKLQRAMVVKRPRVNHSMHVIESHGGNKFIAVVGGHRCNLTGQPVTAPASGNYLTNDVYIYPIHGGKEVQSLNLPFAVCSHAGATVGKNKIVLFGGFSTDGILRTIVSVTFVESETREGLFSLHCEIVSQPQDRQTIPRMIHSASPVNLSGGNAPVKGFGFVILFGGLTVSERHSGGMPTQRLQCTSEVEIFESSGSVILAPLVDYNITNEPPPPRAAHAATPITGKGMAICGGIGLNNEVFGDCWILETTSAAPPYSFTWREICISPKVPRLGHTLYQVSSDILVIIGGHANADGSPSDTPIALELDLSSRKSRPLLHFPGAALSWHSGSLHAGSIILWGGIAGNEHSARKLAEHFPATRLEVVDDFFRRHHCVSSIIAGAIAASVVSTLIYESDQKGSSDDSWGSLKQLLVETLINSASTNSSCSDTVVTDSDLFCSGKQETVTTVAAVAVLSLSVGCYKSTFEVPGGFAEAAAQFNQSFKRMIGTFASTEAEKAQKLLLPTSTSLSGITATVSSIAGLVILMGCYRESQGSLSAILNSPGWASAVQLNQSFKRVIGAFADNTLKSTAITAAQAAAETLSPFLQTAVDSVASSSSTGKSPTQQPTIIVHEMPDDINDSDSDTPVHSYSLRNTSKCPPPSDSALRESSFSPTNANDDIRKPRSYLGNHRRAPRGVHNERIHHVGKYSSSSSSASPTFKPPRMQHLRRSNRHAAHIASGGSRAPVGVRQSADRRAAAATSSEQAQQQVGTTCLPPSYLPSNIDQLEEEAANISSLPKSYTDFVMENKTPTTNGTNGSSLSISSSSQLQSSISSKPSVGGGTVIKVKCAVSSGALVFNITEKMPWEAFLSTVWDNITPVLPEGSGTPDTLLSNVTLLWIDPDDSDEMHLMCAAHYRSFIESSVGKGRGRIVARPKQKTAPRPPPSPPKTPPKKKTPSQRVNKQWTRGKLIGRGTYGTVYTALDHEDGSTFAVKRIPVEANTSNEKQIEDLQREIEMLGQLKHKNIVTLLGTKRGPSCIYIMMEYMAGGSVAAMVRQYGRNGRGLSSAVIQCFLRQILEGLAYLHDNKIIHRDIKGDNLFCDDKGLVKLGDFGASKYLVEACTYDKGSGLRGTVLFLSPEAVHSKYSFASDMWALGCTVIEMMTGLPPWPKKHREHPFSVAYHIAHSGEAPEIPENCPESAALLLKNCLMTNPEDRPSAAQLLSAPFLLEKFEEMEVSPEDDHPQQDCSEFSTLPLTSATFAHELMRTTSETPPDSPSTASSTV